MLGFQGGVSIPLVKGGVKAPPAKRQCRAGPKAGARRGFTVEHRTYTPQDSVKSQPCSLKTSLRLEERREGLGSPNVLNPKRDIGYDKHGAPCVCRDEGTGHYAVSYVACTSPWCAGYTIVTPAGTHAPQ